MSGKGKKPDHVKDLRVRGAVETLLVVLGDQLDPLSPVLEGIDRERDALLLMEVAEEATHVPSHRQRTVIFLSAMRHYALEMTRKGYRVHYVRLDERGNTGDFDGEVERAVRRLSPGRLLVIRPGEWRVLEKVMAWEKRLGVPVAVEEDPHFLIDPAEFSEWASGRKQLVMEHFYRMMRRRHRVLVDGDGNPAGGEWNFDRENRKPWKEGLEPPDPRRFRPDAVTREVMEIVEKRFPEAPGRLDSFGWPVTRRQALSALRDFVENRLPLFGDFQDAMAAGEPWLWHSLLSPALNLKLLNPRECLDAAVEAHRSGQAPLNAVEGFVRQILGWREFIRGVYWHEGKDYGKRNGLRAQGELPELYWTGDTEMVCLRESVGQVLEHGYGHHIQRLMITGNFALIAGIHPREVSDWYLAMYVDAVDWVTLPNTLGMVLHADGGVVGTKPYAASGRYVERMSDYCRDCSYEPGKRTGGEACPFTVLYWDFLARHRERFDSNRRMAMSLRNLDRLKSGEIRFIRKQAKELRAKLGIS